VFARRNRLPRAAFSTVLKGRRISTTHFVAVISKEVRGYGVIVPKKVARLSVTRHRIRRRTLAALAALPLPKMGVVLFPKLPVNTLPFMELKAELTTLLSKLK
jgi:ribonuclease P protein component